MLIHVMSATLYVHDNTGIALLLISRVSQQEKEILSEDAFCFLPRRHRHLTPLAQVCAPKRRREDNVTTIWGDAVVFYVEGAKDVKH